MGTPQPSRSLWLPVLTWLSTLSSLRVLFWYMALMMLIMPALVMKLDSMLRLCSVLFSASISATACRMPVSPQGVTPGCHLTSPGLPSFSGGGGDVGRDSRWPRGRYCASPPG